MLYKLIGAYSVALVFYRHKEIQELLVLLFTGSIVLGNIYAIMLKCVDTVILGSWCYIA